MRRKFYGALIVAVVWATPALGQTINVVGFNVESGGANPSVVDDIVAQMGDVDI